MRVPLEHTFGTFIDPLTGDLPVSTFGGGSRVIVVQGFAAPSAIPEPTSLALIDTGVVSLMAVARRRRSRNG